MRLFIAIQLEDSVRNALTAVQNELRTRRVSGNYTKSENLHLTLAFIGEYSDPDWVLEVMRTVEFPPFPLRPEGFGCFGDLYWCGVGGGQEALAACVRRLRHALAEADIPFDRKRFSPHITLVRKAGFQRLPAVTVPTAEMEVTRLSLLRSDRGKNGMLYTELGSVDARRDAGAPPDGENGAG